MGNMYMRRMSATSCGLCLVVGALATGCIDGALDDQNDESSTSSEIVFNGNSNYAMVGVQSNKCVGPVGRSTAVGVQLEIETCTGTTQACSERAIARRWLRVSLAPI